MKELKDLSIADLVALLECNKHYPETILIQKSIIINEINKRILQIDFTK